MHAGPDNDSRGASSPAPGGESLQGRLIEILQRISGADPEQITPEARLIEDIGIDSLGFYEILIEADECLGIKIREEDLLRFRTVGDVQRHLESLESGDGTNS
jgi:acyl carrier protein